MGEGVNWTRRIRQGDFAEAEQVLVWFDATVLLLGGDAATRTASCVRIATCGVDVPVLRSEEGVVPARCDLLDLVVIGEWGFEEAFCGGCDVFCVADGELAGSIGAEGEEIHFPCLLYPGGVEMGEMLRSLTNSNDVGAMPGFRGLPPRLPLLECVLYEDGR